MLKETNLESLGNKKDENLSEFKRDSSFNIRAFDFTSSLCKPYRKSNDIQKSESSLPVQKFENPSTESNKLVLSLQSMPINH